MAVDRKSVYAGVIAFNYKVPGCNRSSRRPPMTEVVQVGCLRASGLPVFLLCQAKCTEMLDPHSCLQGQGMHSVFDQALVANQVSTTNHLNPVQLNLKMNYGNNARREVHQYYLLKRHGWYLRVFHHFRRPAGCTNKVLQLTLRHPAT